MMQSGQQQGVSIEQQQQNQLYLQQQWMMQQMQQQQHQQPQVNWNQQTPPQPQQQFQQQQLPQQNMQQPQQQQQQYQIASQPTSADEIRTLWIGDLQYWMDESYIYACFAQSGEVASVKLIRNKQTTQLEGYGFIEFVTRAAAERVLQTYNGTPMPNVEQTYRLNWASFGAGEKRNDDTPDFTIFVGDLAADVTDYILLETFKPHYPSVKSAKVVTDRLTACTKGYGFVKFADEGEQLRAMTEMNGMYCSSRAMRIGEAANKKTTGATQQYPKASYQSNEVNQNELDPNNTTIFVGGLDSNVTDEHLRQVFSQCGELVHVKVPVGKRCAFVQFANRSCAEEALQMLNGTMLGGQSVRLSWGRSPNKQDHSNGAAKPHQQPESNHWNGASGGGYYGYAPGPGYDANGYAQPAQNPNAYYANPSTYGSYQQQQ